ncbi:unknown protein [Seminavis robusta]|uniref:Uncharacterized protein n=1 Tax=Seminavis robusta TaxID=568900 RepID=A0A9N8DCQ0_9STRA|nr:unknown protein [Seminavis robusta]|eukprot:Sro36_g022910.1 n/a (130) ;mRNA; f:118703-119092
MGLGLVLGVLGTSLGGLEGIGEGSVVGVHLEPPGLEWIKRGHRGCLKWFAGDRRGGNVGIGEEHWKAIRGSLKDLVLESLMVSHWGPTGMWGRWDSGGLLGGDDGTSDGGADGGVDGTWMEELMGPQTD